MGEVHLKSSDIMKFFILLGLIIVLTSALGEDRGLDSEENELGLTSVEGQEIQNQLVDDRRQRCRDRARSCKYYRRKRYCNKYKSWMTKKLHGLMWILWKQTW